MFSNKEQTSVQLFSQTKRVRRLPKVRNFTGVMKGERQFFNYTFTDVVTGQSYVLYYAGKTHPSEIVLNPFVFQSNPLYTDFSQTSTTPVPFDTPVEKTVTINGEANCKFHATARVVQTAWDYDIDFSLERIRNGTATVIGSATATGFSSAAAATGSITFNCTKTRLVRGDVLRLTVFIDMEATNVNNRTALQHDPNEGTTDYDLKVYVPFRVDL